MKNTENVEGGIAKTPKIRRRRRRKQATVARPKRDTKHTEIIAEYVSRGYSTEKFMATIAEYVIGHSCKSGCKCEQEAPLDPDEEYEDDEDLGLIACQWREFMDKAMPGKRVVPDAFKIHDELGEIEIVEVDVTHHTDNAKLLAYGKLWEWMDHYDSYGVRVTLVDRFGVERHFDGMELAYHDSVYQIPVSPCSTRLRPE